MMFIFQFVEFLLNYNIIIQKHFYEMGGYVFATDSMNCLCVW